MGTKPVIKCSVCQKTFSAQFNLRKHGKKYHPDQIDLVAPKKTYSFHCDFCNRNYSHLKDLNYHKNKVHKHLLSDNRREVAIRKVCPLCHAAITTNSHFTETHDIPIESIQIEFSSLEDFKTWKGMVESDSKTLFVKQRGTYSTGSAQIIVYSCHRSGRFVTKGKGLRRPRNGGSKKINGHCPANMRVVCREGACRVDFVYTHVGHDCDLSASLYKNPTVADDLGCNIEAEAIHEEVVLESCCDLEKEKEQFKEEVWMMIDKVTSVDEIQVLRELWIPHKTQSE